MGWKGHIFSQMVALGFAHYPCSFVCCSLLILSLSNRIFTVRCLNWVKQGMKEPWLDESELQLIDGTAKVATVPERKTFEERFSGADNLFLDSFPYITFLPKCWLLSKAVQEQQKHGANIWNGCSVWLHHSPEKSRVPHSTQASTTFTVWNSNTHASQFGAHSHFLWWKEVNCCLQETSVLLLLPPFLHPFRIICLSQSWRSSECLSPNSVWQRNHHFHGLIVF